MSPASREFVVNQKKSRCVDVDATVKSALENRDIVKGFKAHAEAGGFARWGIEVMRLSAEIGKRANLPVYIHFGQLSGLPESGNNRRDPATIIAQLVPLLKPRHI